MLVCLATSACTQYEHIQPRDYWNQSWAHGHAHHLSMCLLCISSQSTSQTTTTMLTAATKSRAQTLMLQTCRLLHTACAVSAHTHCAAKQNRDPSRLQNCSQHLSLLHIPAEQKPHHAAAEIPGSGSGSVVSLGRRIWTCPHLSDLSSMKHCSCFCIRHSQGQLLLLL